MKRILLLLSLALPLSVAAQQRISSSRIEVTSALDELADAAVVQLLAPYKAKVDSVMMPVLGESLTGMSGSRPESLLGNWAADAMVWATDNDSLGCADFGLLNVGGLRNNMPKGTVRRGDILLISPFQNFLCIVALKGSDVVELMRNIASVGGEAVSREVRLEITKDGKLLNATIGGQPIDPERTYRIATIDYLAEGNDRMTALKRAVSVRRTPLLASDVMMQCIRAHKVIDAKMEGRVRIMYN